MRLAIAEIHSIEYIISIKPWLGWSSKQNFFYFKPLDRQFNPSHLQRINKISSIFHFESIRSSLSATAGFTKKSYSVNLLQRGASSKVSQLIFYCLDFSKIKKSCLLVIWIWLSKTVIIFNRLFMGSFDPRPGKMAVEMLMIPLWEKQLLKSLLWIMNLR